MKIRTLIILSVLFFVLGAAGGGAYAFVSGDNVLAPVAGLLPSPKSPEEKMIEDFIDQQEKKQTRDEDKQPQSEDEKQEDDKQSEQDAPAVKDPKPAEPKDNDKPDTTKEDDSKRLGQPTVSDGKTLRVRETPDTNGEVLIGIPNTEKVEIIAEKNGWYQIITANGTKGWVSAEYMKEI